MNKLLQLQINKVGRDFVIGDIHGKYDQLMLGLSKVNFDFEKDRLLAVGDLIDRGPQSMQCLELIDEEWFYTVIGNHEMIMADALEYAGAMRMWTMNGGDWHYSCSDMEIDLLKDYYVDMIYNSLPVAIEFIATNGQRVGITHAGLPRAWTWAQVKGAMKDVKRVFAHRTVQELIWTRTRIQQTGLVADILGIDLLINGHTPSKKEVWRGNNVFIDLGAYNPYQLVPINVIDLFDRMGTNKERCIPA